MNNRYLPEGELIREYENREYLSGLRGLERACERRRILEAFALLCDGDFNLHFDLGGIPGIMPREEVVRTPAGEPVKDIAERYGFTPGYTALILSRTRKKLKEHLIREEFIYE